MNIIKVKKLSANFYISEDNLIYQRVKKNSWKRIRSEINNDQCSYLVTNCKFIITSIEIVQ